MHVKCSHKRSSVKFLFGILWDRYRMMKLLSDLRKNKNLELLSRCLLVLNCTMKLCVTGTADHSNNKWLQWGLLEPIKTLTWVMRGSVGESQTSEAATFCCQERTGKNSRFSFGEISLFCHTQGSWGLQLQLPAHKREWLMWRGI